MALFGFKKKNKEKKDDKDIKQKKTANALDIKKTEKKEAKKEAVAKKPEEKKQETKSESKAKKEIITAPKVLQHAHITEKATVLQGLNQYVFRVFPESSKNEIKKSVEEVYNVKVEDVRIVNIKPKKRRLGRVEGMKPGYKKAIVKLSKGQSIELLPR